uniref:Uncharacterized protein n=1 Tax=Panagrolaimus sp. ES5 TaxID=591445 RepID=A0AC34FS42_9BILA
MFWRNIKKQVKEFNQLNKKRINAPEIPQDEHVSSMDFTVDDYVDFADEPGDDNVFDNVREQFEHIIDMQDVEIEFDSHPEIVKDAAEPLFLNSPNSVTEFSMAMMALSRDKNLTDSAVDAILNLFRVMLPESNKVPSSYQKVKSIVKENAKCDLTKEITVICAACLKDICTCGKLDKTIFIKFDIQYQLEELIGRYQTTMDEFRTKMLHEVNIMDIHQSQYYRETLQKIPTMLPLSLYTDGGRYTKTGAYEGWPIVAFALDLPPKLRHSYCNIILLGYWYGKSKPDWSHIFKEIGPALIFKFNGRQYRVKYLQCIADIPARQSLLSMISVNGYNCCYNCDIKGQYIGHVVFPYAETNARNAATFLNFSKELNGVTGHSVLYEKLERFPQGVVIDLMHSVFRGPIEDDIKRLLKGFRRNESERLLIRLSAPNVEILDSLLSKIKFPVEFQRNKIRPTTVFATWKASELKLFGLYVVPTILFYLASKESATVSQLLENMILYSSAIRILTEQRITPEMINDANEILKYWAKGRRDLWTVSAMTFKAHENLHLVQQVLTHGPLSTHSAFAGESAIGQLGKNISCYNPQVSATQIAERMSLQRASNAWLIKNGTPEVNKYFTNHIIHRRNRKFDPVVEVKDYFAINSMNGLYHAEIQVRGFSISPSTKTNILNCYIGLESEEGFKAMKLMAIFENSSKELFFCGYALNVLPYSQLISNSFLANYPSAYKYCCYGKALDFEKKELFHCNVTSFVAKFVLIEVPSVLFLMSLTHPYEHN